MLLNILVTCLLAKIILIKKKEHPSDSSFPVLGGAINHKMSCFSVLMFSLFAMALTMWSHPKTPGQCKIEIGQTIKPPYTNGSLA